MSALLLVTLVQVATSSLGTQLPPPPILDDPQAAPPTLPGDGRRTPVESEDPFAAPALDEVLVLNTDAKAVLADVPFGVGAAQAVTGGLIGSGVTAASCALAATSLYCGGGNPACWLFGCATGAGLLCGMPALVGLVGTKVGDTLSGSTRSALFPSLAAYAAFGLDVVILTIAGAAALSSFSSPQLLGGWTPYIAIALGVGLSVVLMALLPAVTYAFLDEENARAADQGFSPLLRQGRKDDARDMLF